MNNYNSAGGIRIKINGKNTKEDILRAVENVLDNLTDDGGVVSFGAVNIYTHMYDAQGNKLSLMKSGQIVQGFSINSDTEFKYDRSGVCLVTRDEIQQIERKLNEEEAARQAEYSEMVRLRKEMRAAENAELENFRKHLCKEFGTNKLSDIVSSSAKIVDRKSMLKYIKENEVPECGYIYRTSIKDTSTNKVCRVLIYDNNFKKMAQVDKL